MKKIIVSMLALTLTMGAFAQDKTTTQKKGNSEWRQKGNGDRMEKLNLTENQKQQMKSFNDDFKGKMQILKNDNSLSEDARKQKRMELMKAHRAQVETILTPEQKKQWQDEKKTGGYKAMKGEDKMAGRAGKRGGRQGFDKMTKDLNLSNDQAVKLKKINEDFRASVEKTKSNNALTADQKKEQMKTLHQQHKQAIEATLTAEQRDKMKEQMKNRRHNSKEITR